MPAAKIIQVFSENYKNQADKAFVSNVYKRIFILISFITLALVNLPLQAQDRGSNQWVRVTDGNISVYTRTDPAQAKPLLLTFSQLQNALAQASVFHVNRTAGLKVIAFHSETEFNQYRLNQGSCAFYQQTNRSEYIVLQDLSPAHRDVSAHEFTHFVIAHAGVQLPLWMNEGIADFYSTFQMEGDNVVFGRAVTGRLGILRESTWLPLDSLVQVSNGSSYYSDPQKMLLFYSESWALAHMLLVSPAYSDRFPEFLRALNAGHDTAASLQLAYGKAPAQVQNDLHEYLDHQHLPTITVHLKSASAASQSSIANISNAEMDVALGDLTPNNATTQAAVETRLAHAASQLPNSAEAEESLGYLALRQGKTADARAHFKTAVDRHSTDPNVLFYLAHFDHEAGVPASQLIPLLERALSLKPDFNDARLELALVATEAENFSKALEALQKLTAPRPEYAFAAAYTEAYCYAHLDKLTEAQASAQRAQKLAATDRERAELTELLDFIKQQS